MFVLLWFPETITLTEDNSVNPSLSEGGWARPGLTELSLQSWGLPSLWVDLQTNEERVYHTDVNSTGQSCTSLWLLNSHSSTLTTHTELIDEHTWAGDLRGKRKYTFSLRLRGWRAIKWKQENSESSTRWENRLLLHNVAFYMLRGRARVTWLVLCMNFPIHQKWLADIPLEGITTEL